MTLPSRLREGLGVGVAWVKLASLAPTPQSPPLQGGEA